MKWFRNNAVCLLHFETFLLLSAAPSSTGINRKTDHFSKRNIPGLAFRLIGGVFLPPFLGHRKVRANVISPSRSHRSQGLEECLWAIAVFEHFYGLFVRRFLWCLLALSFKSCNTCSWARKFISHSFYYPALNDFLRGVFLNSVSFISFWCHRFQMGKRLNSGN